MKGAGLVVTERNGTSIVYSLNESVLEESLEALLGLFDVGRKGGKR